MTTATIRFRHVLWASCLASLLLPYPSAAQELPTVKPEDVGVSSEKVEELSKFMQSLVDDGKIAGGVTVMASEASTVVVPSVAETIQVLRPASDSAGMPERSPLGATESQSGPSTMAKVSGSEFGSVASPERLSPV